MVGNVDYDTGKYDVPSSEDSQVEFLLGNVIKHSLFPIPNIPTIQERMHAGLF